MDHRCQHYQRPNKGMPAHVLLGSLHFHWATSGDYVTQVTAIGPLGLEYVNAKDDPRHKGFVM
jgi:hypothetical protein